MTDTDRAMKFMARIYQALAVEFEQVRKETEAEFDKSLREFLEQQFNIEGWNVRIEREGALIHAIVRAVKAILQEEGKK